MLEILAAAEAALAAPIALDGHALVFMEAERLSARRSPDGRTYQANMVLRALTEKGA